MSPIAPVYRIVACRPLDTSKLTGPALQAWNDSVAEAGCEPPIWPGSITSSCAECGLAVPVGPLQQKQIARWKLAHKKYRVLCLMCCGAATLEFGRTMPVINLGDPDQQAAAKRL